MFRTAARYGLVSILIASSIVASGFGIVLLLTTADIRQTVAGFALCALGASLLLIVLVLVIRRLMAPKSDTPLDLAEQHIARSEKKRINREIRHGSFSAITRVLYGQTSTSARQDARAKRVRDAYKQNDVGENETVEPPPSRISARAEEIRAARATGEEPSPPPDVAPAWLRFVAASIFALAPVAYILYRLIVWSERGLTPRSLFVFLFG